jgi:hypothetical protein
VSDYGKRGGTSATAGRKSALYKATAPDGRVLTRRTFQTDAPEALMIMFRLNGVWYDQGVYDTAPAWMSATAIAVLARRVK